MTTHCGHSYHGHCILEYAVGRNMQNICCPMCRASLRASLRASTDNSDSDSDSDADSDASLPELDSGTDNESMQPPHARLEEYNRIYARMFERQNERVYDAATAAVSDAATAAVSDAATAAVSDAAVAAVSDAATAISRDGLIAVINSTINELAIQRRVIIYDEDSTSINSAFLLHVFQHA